MGVGGRISQNCLFFPGDSKKKDELCCVLCNVAIKMIRDGGGSIQIVEGREGGQSHRSLHDIQDRKERKKMKEFSYPTRSPAPEISAARRKKGGRNRAGRKREGLGKESQHPGRSKRAVGQKEVHSTMDPSTPSHAKKGDSAQSIVL